MREINAQGKDGLVPIQLSPTIMDRRGWSDWAAGRATQLPALQPQGTDLQTAADRRRNAKEGEEGKEQRKRKPPDRKKVAMAATGAVGEAKG